MSYRHPRASAREDMAMARQVVATADPRDGSQGPAAGAGVQSKLLEFPPPSFARDGLKMAQPRGRLRGNDEMSGGAPSWRLP